MTTATIGQPTPLPQPPTDDFLAMARAEAQQHTLCSHCQADMVSWRLANPNATKVDAEDAHAQIWQNCPPCAIAYCEHLDEVDRQARREANSLETAEHAAYTAKQARHGEDTKWHCNACGELTKADATEKYEGNLSKTTCNRCSEVVPRVIDLTKPMVCIVSVRVEDDDSETPY